MTRTIYTGMLGLGDNIYQRAVVRDMGDIVLQTPWPQVYADLPNVLCAPISTGLRTQAKNMQRSRYSLSALPPANYHRIGYTPFRPGTMLQGILNSVGKPTHGGVTFDLPRYPSDRRGRPYIVVRPATIRSEWQAAARNPAEGYISAAAQAALNEGYEVICVADLQQGAEWVAEPLPPASGYMVAGELSVEELFALVQHSAGVIGGVGWLLPAALAYQVPMLLLYGGWGAYNGPDRVLDPRISTRNLIQALPDRFCRCAGSECTSCDKTINDLERYIRDFLKQIHFASTRVAG